MSVRHSHTTSDFIPWETAISLTRKLYRDGDYRMSLLVSCGIFLGLRISDLLSLTWAQVLSEGFRIVEKKTGKVRGIVVNKDLRAHVEDCYSALRITDANQRCFLGRTGNVITVQMVNRKLKTIKVRYRLKGNISTHSLRKTFARAIWENQNAKGNGSVALVYLSQLLNHSSPAISRRYLGIQEQELGQLYESLSF